MLNATPMRPAVLAVLAMLVAPAIAAAQPGNLDPGDPPPGMTADLPPGLTPVAPPVAPTAAPPAPPAPIDLAASRDAAADRAVMTSTAIAVPTGHVDFSLRCAQGGVVLSAAGGLGGGLEVSADLGGAVDFGALGAGMKLAIVRNRAWSLAVQGAYHKLGTGDDGGDAGVWSGGAVATFVNDDASAVFSLGGGIAGASEGDSAPYAWGSLLLGTGAFRPIFEGVGTSGGFVGFLGGRLGGGVVALDGGVLLVSGGGASTGLPMVGLTVRP